MAVLVLTAVLGILIGVNFFSVTSGLDRNSQVQDGNNSKRFLETPSGAAHLFVSPSGSDTANDGHSEGAPFKSLAKALSQVSHYSGQDIYIELLRGYHNLDTGLNIQHKGSGKLTIRAYNGHEVHVTGGKQLSSSVFKRVTDQHILGRLSVAARTHVRVVNLRHINIMDYGSINRYGFHHSRIAPLEVFYNGEPLKLARWPNQGYINIVGLVDGEAGKSFRYNSQRPGTWRNESEIWTYGYWRWSWADRAIKVQALDTANKVVTLAEKTTFGLTTDYRYSEPTTAGVVPCGVGHHLPVHQYIGHWSDTSNSNNGYSKQGGYFRFFNVLSELDEPGEYYMDRASGNLYVWIPNSNGQIAHSDNVYVSLLDHCITLSRGSSNVVFKDFTLEACRGMGILGYDLKNITIENMEVRNTGGYNVKLGADSRDCTISRSYFHDGDGAVTTYGGNRKTLESSGIVIEDNIMWRYSREGAAGYDAVSAFGVGTLVRYNHIHEGQYNAIRYQGNNHLMEYNHIHHCCVNASDCGAVHTGRDWTGRGNTIQYNYIHHILRLVPGADVRGVMLDDQSSGTIIKKNVFYDNQVHANIGGGRDNIIENNIMYNATSWSMQFDERGTKHRNDADLYRALKAVPYNSSVWTTMYPEMKDFDHQNKALPEGNQIVRNLFYNEPHKQIIQAHGQVIKPSLFNISQSGWIVDTSDLFDVQRGDYRIKCYAAEWAKYVNFPQAISPDKVGPRYPVGPSYKRQARVPAPTGSGTAPCVTHAPPTDIPQASFLPDGSSPNITLFNASKTGCWFRVSKCSDDPAAVGTYRDVYGESHAQAGSNETMCFKRAVAQWKYCGSHPNEQISVTFGPTGASTIVGDGCFFAMYGCPKHGGPADGHVIPGRIIRDFYAEQHANGSHNEQACLSRAVAQWRYCGSNKNHPVTSIFRPTGAFRTAGAGCWIKIEKCPKITNQKLSFYDAFGAANFHSDEDSFMCFERASYYWRKCGSYSNYRVTAFYRPTAKSHTVP